MVCDVCSGISLVDLNATNQDNVIVRCSECNVSVHQLCYGALEAIAEWKCVVCSSDTDSSSADCVLCPNKDGPMKKTTKNNWIHVVCAMFTKNVVIVKPDVIEGIDISGIAKSSFTLKCCLCQKKDGACVTCMERGCTKKFHVSCAQKNGGLMEFISSKNVDHIVFAQFCPGHRKKNLNRQQKNIEKVAERAQKRKKDGNIENQEWLAVGVLSSE